ncbi:MAG: hypothetical protein Q8O67_29355 [Deltaproteobacteria bacterium]|nr:hypothetical protein [Deltaproteobacteria bacterium]
MRLLLVVLVVALLCAPALAAKKKKKRRPVVRAPSGPVEVPIEIAAGPILLLPSPPAFGEQPAHFGLQLEMGAIIDRELIRRHRNQIPPWARNVAGNVDEVRVRPLWLALVPQTFVISPQIVSTGIYGAIWRPYGLSVPLVDQPGFRVQAGADLDLVALFLHSKTLGGGTSTSQSLTLVLRPGLRVAVAAEVPVTKELLVSGGWSSDVFVPQALGRPPWEVFPLEDSIWHLGGPFLMVHYRFPYTITD